MSESISLSRRQFLTGCAGCAASLTAPAAAESISNQERLRTNGGEISPDGQAAIGALDRQFQRQRAAMETTVNAVDDIGLDPTGKTPVNEKLESAIATMGKTRIEFPADGTFALSEKLSAIPNGPIELIGNGCTFTVPQNEEMTSFALTLPSGSLISDITIDQSATGSIQEFVVKTKGTIRLKNLTIKGYAPAKRGSSDGGGGVDAMFSPIALSNDAAVQVTGLSATGGTAAGTHNESDLPSDSPENTLASPMGIWVGQANKGTIQLINPHLRGWSNGIYGGRTNGRVEIRGGTFVNNFNSQVRLGGGSIVDGASMLLDDREWSDKGPFKIGHQGVYAIRVDPSDIGNRTDPIKFTNLKIMAKSMREGSSLIDFESEAGPGIIRNCEIINHLDRSVVLGESPSGGGGPTNILVEHCLIKGKSRATVIEIQNRSQSRVVKTCIELPGAGPDSIQGAQVGPKVSFGQCRSGSGLKSPDKVGSGGNISSLPAPDYTGSTAGARPGSSSSRQQVQKETRNWAMKALSALVAAAVGIGLLVMMAGAAILKILR